MKNITFLTTRQTFSNFKYGLIVLLCIQSFTLSATDYYVNAISGNDSNNGQSAFDAFRSISRMSSVSLRPGDTVYFMNGTYTRPGSTLWNITESGTENAYITIQNYPGHSPVLEFDSWSGLNLINGASYLRFSGLKIKDGVILPLQVMKYQRILLLKTAKFMTVQVLVWLFSRQITLP